MVFITGWLGSCSENFLFQKMVLFKQPDLFFDTGMWFFTLVYSCYSADYFHLNQPNIFWLIELKNSLALLFQLTKLLWCTCAQMPNSISDYKNPGFKMNSILVYSNLVLHYWGNWGYICSSGITWFPCQISVMKSRNDTRTSKGEPRPNASRVKQQTLYLPKPSRH